MNTEVSILEKRGVGFGPGRANVIHIHRQLIQEERAWGGCEAGGIIAILSPFHEVSAENSKNMMIPVMATPILS